MSRKKFSYLFIFLGVASLLLFLGTQAKAAVLQDVIINEISWSGSYASNTDKWIELRNASTSPIDLVGWTIENAVHGATTTLTLDPSFCSTTTIASSSYFLISNATSGFSQIADNNPVQCATNTINLIGDYSANGSLLLKQGGVTLIDQTPASLVAAWPAGAAAPGPATSTMARNFSIADGSATSSWHTTIIANRLDAASIARGEKGTPGGYNGYLISGTLSQLNANATGTTYIAARIHMVPATTTATATANFSATGTYTAHLFQAVYDFFAYRDTNGDSAYTTASEPYRSLDNSGAGYSLTSAGTSSLNFVMAVNPTISSTTPSTASIGETITITGTYFGDSTTTSQGTITMPQNIAATSRVTSWSSTSIQVVIPPATTPPGPQTGQLIVTIGWTPQVPTTLTIQPIITSAVATQNSVVINFDGFVNGGPASVASNYTLTSNGSPVSLATAWAEFRGNKVYIKGISLTAGNTFSIAAGSAITSIANTSIKTASSTAAGTVIAAPNITSVSPSSGVVGATITIIGTAFGSATPTVYFSPGQPTGGTPPQPIQAVVTAWSTTRATTTVPTGAKSGPINIVTSSGAESGMLPNAFFDIPANLKFNVLEPDGTPLATTSAMIIIGGPGGPVIYYVGINSTTYSNGTTTISNGPSMGYNWAFDASGTYAPATGRNVDPSTTTVFSLATSTTKISGTISGASANTTLVIFADPLKETMGLTEKTNFEPIFVVTNANGTTSYNIGLSATGTYMVGVEDPGFGGSVASSAKLAPANKTVNASTTTAIAGLNFTFTSATARIHGKVEKAAAGTFATGPGVNDFHVQAYQPIENGLHASAMINSNGEFDLYVNPGVYLIEAGGPNIPFPVKEQIEVKEGEARFATSSTDIDITLVIKAPTEYISGQVTDSNGNGISGAAIFAWSTTGPGGQAFTDSNGSYKLYLSPGTYTLEGFTPQYGKLTSRSGVTVLSSASSTVDFSVSSEMATISGTVLKNSTTTADMEVWITQGDNGWNLNRTRTDSSGAYSLSVPYGSEYYLHIGSPGRGEIYKEKLATFNSGNTSTSSTSTINTVNITVRISPASAFSSAFIEARDTVDSRKRGFANTDVSADTSYREYVLEVSKPSNNDTWTYNIEGGIPGYGPLVATTTAIASTTNPAVISITLGSAWQVSGTIADPDASTTGNQAESAFVWATSPSGHGGGQVDASGNFSFYLKQGTYDFGIDKKNYSGIVVPGVTINAATVITGLSLSSAGLTISGLVTKSGTAETGAWVWAANSSGGWAGDQTDGNGNYSLKVTSGTWLVKAASEGYELATPQSVTIASGTSTANLILSAMSNYTVASPTVESIVPKNGGIIQGSNVKIEAPAGALDSQDSNNGRISIQKTTSIPQTNGFKSLGGAAFEISAYNASGTAFTNLNSDITVSLTYTAADLAAASSTQAHASQLSLGYWDSTVNTWTTIPTNAATSTDGSVTYTGTTNHLSPYAPVESSGLDAPSTPTNLTAAAGNQSVTLTWSASAGATKYYIYRYRSSDQLWPYLSETTALTYVNSPLTNGTTYSYKISAANADDDESTSTAAVSAVPTLANEPQGPGSGGGGGTPEPTPTMPITTTGTVTATAAAGGKTTVTSAENTIARVELPVNAVSANTAVTITPVAKTATTIAAPVAAVPTGKSVVGGYVYNYTAAAGTAAVTTFNQAVTLTFTYTDSQITGLNESTLKAYYWNATTSQWVGLTTTVNAPTNTLTCTTNHFTYFAIIGEAAAVVTPTTPTTPVTKPISQMTITELQAEIARITALIVNLQAELAKLTGATQSFAVNLYQGLKNNAETKRLQEFLISKGYLGAGFNTGNYLSLTVGAVKAYQTAKAITPVSGYFGPLTRAAVNADIGATQ